jgi:predicted DNA-binding antitoxin AbrB/MazE fold protein
MTIHAIYENGVFKPIEKVDLPEKSQVAFEPRVVTTEPRSTANAPTPAMAKIYEILSRRYDTNDPKLAERHNEHQL